MKNCENCEDCGKYRREHSSFPTLTAESTTPLKPPDVDTLIPNNIAISPTSYAPIIDTAPGKHTDEFGNFYFSCSGNGITNSKEKSVVVGQIQYEPIKVADGCKRIPRSTCPLMGIVQIWDTSNIGPDDDWPQSLIRLEGLASQRNRPSLPSMYDGVSIGFVTLSEWNECFMYEPEPQKSRLLKEIDDTYDDSEPEWVCVLFTEVGLYELHTNVG